MVNEQLEDSLRREIEGYRDSRLNVIRQEISTLQSLLNESLSTFLDRRVTCRLTAVWSFPHRAPALSMNEAELAPSNQRAPGRRATWPSSIGDYRDNEQKSQAEVLKTS